MLYRLSIVREKVSEETPEPLSTSQRAAQYLTDHCYRPEEGWREQCHVVFLDSLNVPQGHLQLSAGTRDKTVFDLQPIIYAVLSTQSTGIILSHNHPTGDSTPTHSDIQQTSRIESALKALGLKFVDHIVLGEGEFYSFAEERKTKFQNP